MIKEAIWKYAIDPGPGEYAISMPMDAIILSAHAQCGKIAIWAKVNPATASRGPRFQETRLFRVFMTGQSLEWSEHRIMNFMGTCLFDHGAYVAHVFELA